MIDKIELFSNLFRDFEAQIGTRDLANLLFESLIDSIKAFKLKDSKLFCEQFAVLSDHLSQTEPKFGVVIYHLANLCTYFEQNICTKDLSEKKWKQMAIGKIKEVIKDSTSQKNLLLKNSEKIEVEKKVILIHDHSHSVQDILAHYKYLHRHFKVIIAAQDFDKTHSNIEKMHSSQIPFQVVPSYMVSHLADKIDMLFFGSLTLKDTMEFVMSPGTHGIITEFHTENIPIYMFINTHKFSLWASKPRSDIHMKSHIKRHHFKPIDYEEIKYSHDRVPADFFTKIVTNEGIFSPQELKSLFDRKLADYKKCGC